jgi:hypothetical protein
VEKRVEMNSIFNIQQNTGSQGQNETVLMASNFNDLKKLIKTHANRVLHIFLLVVSALTDAFKQFKLRSPFLGGLSAHVSLGSGLSAVKKRVFNGKKK